MRYSPGKHICPLLVANIVQRIPEYLASPSIVVQRGSCCGNLLLAALSPDLLQPLSGDELPEVVIKKCIKLIASPTLGSEFCLDLES